MVLDMRCSRLVVTHRRGFERTYPFGLDSQVFHDREDRGLRNLHVLVVAEQVHQLPGPSNLVGRFEFGVDQFGTAHAQCLGFAQLLAGV